jgi:hypothetical protein
MTVLFSVVDTNYSVQVYFVLHELCLDRAGKGLYIVPEGDEPATLATAAEIRKAFRSRNEVKLSERGDRNWIYKMVRHT